MNSRCRFALTACALLVSGTAAGEPYELYAKYTTPKGQAVEVKIPSGQPFHDVNLIPSNVGASGFEGLFLRARKDPLSKLQLQRIASMVVRICGGGRCGPESSPPDLLMAQQTVTVSDFIEREIRVFPANFTESSETFRRVLVSVYPKYADAYLCGVELGLRDEAAKSAKEKGKSQGAEQPAAQNREKDQKKPKSDSKAPSDSTAPDVLTSPTSAYANALLFSRPLPGPDGRPIVFSFCAGVHDEIDWKKVAEDDRKAGKDPEAKADPDRAHERHKALMLSRVKEAIQKQTGDEVVLAKFLGEPRDNVYARLSHTVTFLQDMSALFLGEYGRDIQDDHENVINKSSVLTLSYPKDSHFCSGLGNCDRELPRVLDAHISYRSKTPAANPPAANGGPAPTTEEKPLIEKDVSLTQGVNGWTISEDLATHIGEDLYVSISYVVKGELGGSDTRLQLKAPQLVRVRNIGTISTFPAYTDVVSAVTKKSRNPADISTQSSIPISWGINLSHGEYAHIAVTFPWMIGWNTYRNPELADTIKIFPHVTLIFPLESDTAANGPRVAFGAGLALANAFTFSGAVTVQDQPQAFLLVGISATDLAKVFMNK